MKTIFRLVSVGVVILLAGRTALAASPSDLLEQGIYSEETKGDLPGAVQLYQQTIREAKANQALAAQAEYHLGVCYYKQQDFTNANAAFATLAKDYPDQTELVRLAQKYLAGVVALQPAPWQDGEDLRLDLKLPGGLKVGFADYTVRSGKVNGENIWRMDSHISAAGTVSYSWVEAVADSFTPIRSRWMHSLLGDMSASYSSNYVELTGAGSNEPVKMDLSGPTFDNEECIQWMRRLPLADGYSASAMIMASLAGRIVNLKMQVSGPESVEVPAGTFSCFKVDLNIKQTFWYSADANRYLVKFAAGGALAELRQISHHTAGEPPTLEDSRLGFSLSAPAGWFMDRNGPQDGADTVSLLNPVCAAEGQLTVKPLALLEIPDKPSARGMADYGLKMRSQTHPNFVTREDSWKNIVIDGQPAVSVVSDFGDGRDKRTIFNLFTMSGTNVAAFDFTAKPNDFAAMQPKFEAIAESLKTK